MTLAVVVKVNDGLVLAADSATAALSDYFSAFDCADPGALGFETEACGAGAAFGGAPEVETALALGMAAIFRAALSSQGRSDPNVSAFGAGGSGFKSKVSTFGGSFAMAHAPVAMEHVVSHAGLIARGPDIAVVALGGGPHAPRPEVRVTMSQPCGPLSGPLRGFTAPVARNSSRNYPQSIGFQMKGRLCKSTPKAL